MIQSIVFFVLGVLFSLILIHNLFCLWNDWKGTKEPMVNDTEADDDDTDDFFNKMKGEFTPIGVDDVDNMVFEMDKEVELSPEEMDFVDGDDLELPNQPFTSGVTNSKLPKKGLPVEKGKGDEELGVEEQDEDMD